MACESSRIGLPNANALPPVPPIEQYEQKFLNYLALDFLYSFATPEELASDDDSAEDEEQAEIDEEVQLYCNLHMNGKDSPIWV